MSTNRSIGRTAFKPKKDRSPNLCAFTFADGRQCRTPRCSGHLHLCYFHAQKEAESLAAQQVGEDISRFLPTKLLTACDLGVALSRTFCAVAQGQIKPKVATTLAYLAQTMLQSIPIAQHEYIESFNTNTWRTAVRASFRQEDAPNTPAPQSAQAAATPAACHSEPAARWQEPAFSSSSVPSPTPASAPPTPVEAERNSSRPGREPVSSSSPSVAAPRPFVHPPANCHSERSEESTSSSTSPLATSHSPLPQPSQPAPSPHTPLPSTGADFAQQLLAVQNSSRSVTPAPSEPRREPGSSVSSFSSASPDSAPALTSSAQPAPASPAPPLPPGFGAPANWDVLIPSKPRRRFSRHWHLIG